MQSYSSLNSFQELRSVVLPRGRQRLPWRLTQHAPVGHINGLATLFRGKAIATNGILVALENEVGDVHIGHTDYFIPLDNESPEAQLEAKQISTANLRQHKVNGHSAEEVDKLYD